jgi:hypothetical protein
MLVAAALALAAGCGGGRAEVADLSQSDISAPTTSTTARSPGDPTDQADQAGGPSGAAGGDAAAGAVHQVARAATDLDVYGAPGDAAPAGTLAATTEFGSPRALLVVADGGDWLQVALPERPNGSRGWIRRSDVEIRTVDESIVVDLAARTLTLFDSGVPVLTTPVAVGTDDNPTPIGAFYVVDKLDTGDPSGPYGQFAFGLSAHSTELSEFAGGDGQVGIHGTDDPSSIGQAVSHGCVRVPAEVAQVLAETVNLGTPVVIS